MVLRISGGSSIQLLETLPSIPTYTLTTLASTMCSSKSNSFLKPYLLLFWLYLGLTMVTCRSLMLKPPLTSWYLNDSLLSLSEVVGELCVKSAEYFTLNSGFVRSSVILWEAYKAVTRGHVIQGVSKKIERLAHIARLASQLDTAMVLLKQVPSRSKHDRVERLRADLDLCLTDTAERQLRWTNQKFYANGNKIGSMLANKLKSFAPRR